VSSISAAQPVEISGATAWLRLWLRGLLGGLVVTGLLFLLIPYPVVRFLNYIGGLFGLAPLDTGHQFYVVLAVAYMALVSAFCWVAVTGSRVQALPVRLLIFGKTMSSLLALLFFVVDVHAFAFLANFVVDGSIALVTWASYRAAKGELA
jgi:hypothetical protein